MAKGQQKKSREARKPKKDKGPKANASQPSPEGRRDQGAGEHEKRLGCGRVAPTPNPLPQAGGECCPGRSPQQQLSRLADDILLSAPPPGHAQLADLQHIMRAHARLADSVSSCRTLKLPFMRYSITIRGFAPSLRPVTGPIASVRLPS